VGNIFGAVDEVRFSVPLSQLIEGLDELTIVWSVGQTSHDVSDTGASSFVLVKILSLTIIAEPWLKSLISISLSLLGETLSHEVLRGKLVVFVTEGSLEEVLQVWVSPEILLTLQSGEVLTA